jgi:hypothetical protein
MNADRLHSTTLNLITCSLLSLLVTMTVLLQHRLEQREGDVQKLEQLRFLPRGEILRPVLLGYHHLGADIVWLRIIQVLGERVVADRDYEWLYHAFDVVTTLDEKYIYAYDTGATVLAELAGRVDLSNQLLEKGLEPNPTAWRIPFVLGFNYFFHLQDHLSAADYMSRAARVPGLPPAGPPPYVAKLAARLYAQGKNPEVAIEFLEGMLLQTQEEWVREQLERRIKRVTVERDLQFLERTVQRYVEIKGHNPPSLSDLVANGLLPHIPAEPYDGEYRFDSQTGEVTSSTHTERMRVYRSSDSMAKKGDIE